MMVEWIRAGPAGKAKANILAITTTIHPLAARMYVKGTEAEETLIC
jgi:hypothetical protein